MKTNVHLGKELSLPPEIAGRRTAVFGISGSGKSNTATVIVEELLAAGEQIVLIDPKGEGWGLLSKANGKPSNLDVIVFGEPHGHIPALDESHGSRLADFVVESGRSVVLSLLGFESDQSERRFVATFLRQLYRRKSKLAQPTRTLVVIEEAHLFVPESPSGAQAELSGAVQRIVRQGRSQGLGTLLVDQRPQDVAKRVITQCETLICHQLVHALDRKALEDWVRGYDHDDHGKKFLASLASLQPGQAWVWSPGWLQIFEQVQVRRRKTYDSGASPDGSAAARQVQRADVDLHALENQLAEMVEKAKADDPKELRKRIKQLEKELQAKQADPESIDKAVQAAIAERDRVWEQAIAERNGIIDDLKNRMDKASQLLHVNGEAVPAPEPTKTPTRKPSSRPAKLPTKRPARPAVEPQVQDGQQLGKCERAILQVLSQHPEGCDSGKLTLLAGYRYSGGFKNSLAKLRQAGLIVGGNTEVMAITAAGEACGPFDPLPEGEDLINYWLTHSSLGKCERAILSALLDQPSGMTSDELCETTGYSYSGGFKNSLAKLRTAGLIQGRNTETMTATETLLEA